jgi:tetratricopeptide (TPR) repeat protein
MWRQVVAQSPGENAPAGEVLRYDVGWKALNTMLKSGRSLSGHERNCCFLNTGGQRFADISAAGDLDFDDDGRVLVPTDWDLDGDMDFWIANRTGPQARFLRNDHVSDHSFVAFKLEGTSCNRDAIGSKLHLHVADGSHSPIRYKMVRAGEGYLAQTSKWIHFGLGDVTNIEKLVITWADGKEETITGLAPNGRYEIKQGAGKARPWRMPNRQLALSPSKITVPESTDKARIVLIAPIPIPQMKYQDAAGQSQSVLKDGKPRLINLWASWCQPCLKELGEWNHHQSDFARSGLEVLAINVDEPRGDRAAQIEVLKKLAAKTAPSFTLGFGRTELVAQFDVLQRSILRRQRTLPVPTSFLVDGNGHLRVIYKGPVDADQLLADAKLLTASSEKTVEASVPYKGRWLGQPAGSAPNQIAIRFIEGGFVEEAEQYIRQLAKMVVDNPLYNRAEANVLLGAMLLDQKKLEQSADAFRAALELDPEHRQSHIELAGILLQTNKPQEAAKHFEAALLRRQNDPELRLKLGKARLQLGEIEEAAKQFRMSAELRASAMAFHNLGNTMLGLKRPGEAIKSYESALETDGRFIPSANNLAWLLATNPDDTLRNGERAVELAEGICGFAAARNPSSLETLSVAYAEVARFDKAIETTQEAIRMAKAAGDLKTAGELRKRLALFQQKKPYRDE